MSFFEEFVNEESLENKTVEVQLDTIKKPFIVRQLSEREEQAIKRKFISNFKVHGEGDGSMDVDGIGLGNARVVASIVWPNLESTEVMEAAEEIFKRRTGKITKILNSSDALSAMLTPGEFDKLRKAVEKLSGTDKRKAEDEMDKQFRNEPVEE